MSDTTLLQKLLMAAAGSAFIVLGTLSNRANAITFNFGGKFNEGSQFEGNLTLDDDFFKTFMENSFDPLVPLALKLPINTATDPSGSFYLNVGSQVSSSSGVTIAPFVALNTPFAYLERGFYTFLGDYELAVNPDLLGICNEDRGYCSGLLYGSPGFAFFPVTATNEKSVPEPSAAIALGILGTLMLVGKRKTLHSKSLFKFESQS